MAYGDVTQFGKETQKEIGRIVKENSPDHKEYHRIAICEDSKGNRALDIRQYLDTQRGRKPYKGFTRTGIKLWRYDVVTLFALLDEVKEEMQITEEELEEAKEQLKKES